MPRAASLATVAQFYPSIPPCFLLRASSPCQLLPEDCRRGVSPQSSRPFKRLIEAGQSAVTCACPGAVPGGPAPLPLRPPHAAAEEGPPFPSASASPTKAPFPHFCLQLLLAPLSQLRLDSGETHQHSSPRRSPSRLAQRDYPALHAMLASLALISRVAPAPRARCFASAAAARSSGKGGPGMDQGPTETGTPGSASVSRERIRMMHRGVGCTLCSHIADHAAHTGRSTISPRPRAHTTATRRAHSRAASRSSMK